MSKRKMWTEAEVETLRKLVNEGKAAENIAKDMEREITSVYSKMSKLKIATKYKRVGKKTPHAYGIGEIVNNTLIVVKHTRDNNKQKAYMVQSIKYPKTKPYLMNEYSLKRGGVDLYLNGRKVCEENSLYSVVSIRPHIIDVEYSKTIAPNHNTPVLFKCANQECDNVKEMKPSTIVNSGFGCKICNNRNYNHVYKVGDIVGQGTLKVIEQTKTKQYRTYIVQSIKYPTAENYAISEYALKNGVKDAYLTSRRICPENSLYSLEDVRPFIINIEEAKKTAPQSDAPILFKCDNQECNHVKKLSPKTLMTQGFSCNVCSAGGSYGNLAYGCYQTHFKLGFESEKILPGLLNRRVDFINWENGMWIEIQGEQHTNVNSTWYESAHEQDLEKRAFAKENTQYNLIEIDMRISSWEYFKEQINKCEYLPSITDDDEKEILKLMEINKRYPVKEIKYMYEVKGYSVQRIADKLNYSWSQINGVLKRNNIKTRGTKKVRCLNNGIVYDSTKIASEELGLNYGSVKSVANPNSSLNSVFGFTFEYVTVDS